MKKLLIVIILGFAFYACKKDSTPAPVVVVKDNDTIKVDSVPKLVKLDSLYRTYLQGKWCLNTYIAGFSDQNISYRLGGTTWFFDTLSSSVHIVSDGVHPEIDTGKYSFTLDTNGVCNGSIRMKVNSQNIGSMSFDTINQRMVITGECYDGGRFSFVKNCKEVTVPKPYVHEVPINQISAAHINLSNLQKGQKSVYVRYEYGCGSMGSQNVKFTQDTLVLEVIDSTGTLYFRETFAEGTQLFGEDIPTQPIIYKANPENGNLMFDSYRRNSVLFHFYGNDTLQLNPNHNATVTQQPCNFNYNDTVFYGNEIGKIDTVKVGDIEILDKTIVSCVPLITIDGYLVYDSSKLFVSQGYNWQVMGWLLTDKYR
jgi:hypothetical protein